MKFNTSNAKSGGNNPKSTRIAVKNDNQTIILPRLDDSTNFAKFGIEYERGAKPHTFGKMYVPLADAKGVKQIEVVFRK